MLPKKKMKITGWSLLWSHHIDVRALQVMFAELDFREGGTFYFCARTSDVCFISLGNRHIARGDVYVPSSPCPNLTPLVFLTLGTFCY